MEEIIIPRCKKCKALQIKLIRFAYEKCWVCNSDLEKVKFKEVVE